MTDTDRTVERLRTLSIGELADVLGCSVRSIERQLSAETFPIAPIRGLGTGTRRHPLRWSPFVVEAFLKTNGREVAAGRRHFFGTAKLA